mgnify:CR=1 FL=1
MVLRAFFLFSTPEHRATRITRTAVTGHTVRITGDGGGRDGAIVRPRPRVVRWMGFMRLSLLAPKGTRTPLGGVVIGFVIIWVTALALPYVLGAESPMRAAGGPTASANLLFFITLELMTGAVGGFVAARLESAGATFRLAIAVLFVGGIVAFLASGTPNAVIGPGTIFLRSALHACGVLIVAMYAWRAANGNAQGSPRVSH